MRTLLAAIYRILKGVAVVAGLYVAAIICFLLLGIFLPPGVAFLVVKSLASVVDFLFTPIAMMVWIPILIIVYRRQLIRQHAAKQGKKPK